MNNRNTIGNNNLSRLDINWLKELREPWTLGRNS